MELSREEKRLVLHFQWKLGFNASESARKICGAYGDKVIGKSTAREWFAKFRAGEESLKDKSHSGRPIEVDRQSVLEAIEEIPSLTTRMLSDDFDCDQATIFRILHELGKVWKKTRWVPHELTEAQKTKRVNAAQTLLGRQEETPFLANRLITGDEKWISSKNPDPHNEWHSPDEKFNAV